MSWRPKGWRNPYQNSSFTWPGLSMSKPKIAHDAYEGGADAIVKILKEEGAFMTPEQMQMLAPERKYPYGWLCFIPVDPAVGFCKDCGKEGLMSGAGYCAQCGAKRFVPGYPR